MAYLGVVARWDLFWADVVPAVGSEQGAERRPVLVVSNDGFNTNFPPVTVLSCTKAEGKKRKVYSFEVVLPKGMVTAQHASILMPQQMRTIGQDASREPDRGDHRSRDTGRDRESPTRAPRYRIRGGELRVDVAVAGRPGGHADR